MKSSLILITCFLSFFQTYATKEPVKSILTRISSINNHDPGKAIAILDSLDRAEQFSLEDSAHFLCVRGWTYQVMTEVGKGMEDIQSGIKLCEMHGMDSVKGHFISYFGTSLYQTGQFERAISKYTESVEIAKGTNNLPLEFSGLVNISAVFIELGQYDTAKVLLEEAIAFTRGTIRKIHLSWPEHTGFLENYTSR